MAFKLGTLEHAKGYVVNKLFEQRRFGGKHLPVVYLRHGYPPNWRHMIKTATEALRKEGIVRIERKRTGRDYADHAVLVWSKLGQARSLLNGYRAKEGLPRLGRDLKTFLPV